MFLLFFVHLEGQLNYLCTLKVLCSTGWLEEVVGEKLKRSPVAQLLECVCFLEQSEVFFGVCLLH